LVGVQVTRPGYRIEQGGEGGGCLLTEPILLAVLAATELVALGRVDAPQPNSRAVDLDCIAIDHAGVANQVFGRRGGGEQGRKDG
jgi:hypothetical protein